MSKQIEAPATAAMAWPVDIALQTWSYGLDAFQRSILFLQPSRASEASTTSSTPQ